MEEKFGDLYAWFLLGAAVSVALKLLTAKLYAHDEVTFGDFTDIIAKGGLFCFGGSALVSYTLYTFSTHQLVS